MAFSPRVWGWSEVAQDQLNVLKVLPTGVGMGPVTVLTVRRRFANK